MIGALIAAAIAFVAALILIVVFFAVRSRRTSEQVGSKKPINAIDTVGLKSSIPEHAQLSAKPTVTENTPLSQSTPAGNLKSRFAALGVLVAAVFGTLSAKLWSMQILEASAYEAESEENRYTTVFKPAPRGLIFDADGVPLVENRVALTVLADPDVAENRTVVQRLSALLGVPHNVVRQRIQDASSGAQSQRVVVSDARMRDVAFIAEHADAFPGVTHEERTIRVYPYGALAAHVLGYASTVTAEAIETAREGRALELGDVVGQAGVELAYDDLLAGDHGQRKVMADAKGNIVQLISETQATKGSDIYLTIKAPVQYVCDTALAKLIAPENATLGTGTGTAGAAVVMNARDGAILAMASYPTYSPTTFVGGINENIWSIYRDDEHHPMVNRAIQGLYPAASTYKAFTGLAALEYGFADTSRTWNCSGEWDGWDSGDIQKCWKHAGHGTLDFRGGIVNSCDVVFYDIAYHFFENRGSVGETAMQDYIKRYRFGELTGIELTGEESGLVPTPEWKAEYFRDYPEDAAWRGGDSTNMVIGQGYVLTTPLQVACAYGAIATGNIMKPHLLKEVRNDAGDVALSFEPEIVATPEVNEAHLSIVRDALHGVATDNPEIAKEFTERGIDPSLVACKTGTGEVAGKDDFAWFVCYYPYEDPLYVVSCLIEEGGGGSSTGAPLGAELLAATIAAEDGSLTTVEPIAGYTGRWIPYVGTDSGRTD